MRLAALPLLTPGTPLGWLLLLRAAAAPLLTPGTPLGWLALFFAIAFRCARPSSVLLRSRQRLWYSSSVSFFRFRAVSERTGAVGEDPEDEDPLHPASA